MWRFLVVFSAALATFAQSTPAPATNNPDATATGSISGRVTDAVTGEPIQGASVSLLQMRFQNGSRQHVVAQSQADGSYRLDGVAAGTYLVRATRDGYVPNQFSGRSFLQLVAGQSLMDANVQLSPESTVTGKVLDDKGAPVPGVRVEAIQQTSRRGHTVAEQKSEGESDRNGAFALKKLPPGTYFIVAEPPESDEDDPPAQAATEGTLLRTLYPRSVDMDGATPIQITPGQGSGDLTIYMQRGFLHHVRGRISDLPGDAQRLRLLWSPRSAVDSPALTETVSVGKNGAFDIDDATPGSYTLRIFAGHSQRLLARQNVDVGAGDVNDVVVMPQQPVVLTGKVTLPDSFPGVQPRIRLIVRPLDNEARGAASVTDVQSDGSIQTTPLDPGPYMMQAIVAPPTLYVKSILLNQQDVTAKAIDLSEAGGTIEIVLGSGMATISGNTSDASSGTAVILVPNPVAPDGSNVLFANTGTAGAFQFPNLRPGDYKVFATAIRDYGTWQNPDFLGRLDAEGTSVSVGENQQQQVQVPVVPQELVEETAAQLGLTLN